VACLAHDGESSRVGVFVGKDRVQNSELSSATGKSPIPLGAIPHTVWHFSGNATESSRQQSQTSLVQYVRVHSRVVVEWSTSYAREP